MSASSSSVVGPAGASGAGSSCFFSLFMALIMQKIHRAMMRKSMMFWMNVPYFDFTESTADDHTDCHVHHIALHGKFLEFFNKSHSFKFLN